MHGRPYVCPDKKVTMRYHVSLICLISLLSLSGCEQSMSEDEISRIGMESCRKPAAFIQGLGFHPQRSAFSSTEKRYKGIVLFEIPAAGDTTRKIWQDSSWSRFGDMGSITTDEEGNVYTAPIPFVNTLDRSLQTIHTLYKISSHTGRMDPFTKLPPIDSVPGVIPFGVLGLYYDCHGKKLYAASVGGSTQDEENGSIYVLDMPSGKVVDQLEGIDAMGLFAGGMTGEKRLYFGRARTSDIQSVKLSKEGYFKGKPQTECSLDGLGPRGMDKARRIRYDAAGNLLIYGLDFSFNLAAQSDKPESTYQFGYNRAEKKWIFMSLR